MPVEKCHEMTHPWKGSDKVNGINALEKKSDGWNLLETSTGHSKDRTNPWEDTKHSGGNEKGNDTTSADCLRTEEWREIQWKTKDRGSDSWENSGQGNDGWDESGHQSKKAKGSAKEYDNPWEANPSCRKEIAKDTTWGGCSGKGWEDNRGWDNDCWGNGGWENRDLGNQIRERKECRNKRYSQDFQEPRGCNPWKAGFVHDNAAFRDYGTNSGGWQTRRGSETNRRNWDVKQSSDGWGRRNRKKMTYMATILTTIVQGLEDDRSNRKVNFSSK